MKRLLLILAIFGTSFLAQSQSEQRFSVFVMDGVETMDECREIQKDFRSTQGVVMARADVHSKRFYIIYTDEAGLSEEKFRTKFKDLGYQVKCYHEGIKGRDEFVPVSADSCNE